MAGKLLPLHHTWDDVLRHNRTLVTFIVNIYNLPVWFPLGKLLSDHTCMYMYSTLAWLVIVISIRNRSMNLYVPVGAVLGECACRRRDGEGGAGGCGLR